MKDERIDLSALDPSGDPHRWDRIVASVASRAAVAQQRRITLGYQLRAWSAPALAISATVALAIWAGALASARNSAAPTVNRQEPAFVLAGWAISDERPSTSMILQVLGEGHAAQ